MTDQQKASALVAEMMNTPLTPMQLIERVAALMAGEREAAEAERDRLRAALETMAAKACYSRFFGFSSCADRQDGEPCPTCRARAALADAPGEGEG